MSGPFYGPWHDWFAWRPVKTRQHGWRWLTTVRRALHYPADIPHAPDPYWVYKPRANDTREEETE